MPEHLTPAVDPSWLHRDSDRCCHCGCHRTEVVVELDAPENVVSLAERIHRAVRRQELARV